jgi:hypothetical protein
MDKNQGKNLMQNSRTIRQSTAENGKKVHQSATQNYQRQKKIPDPSKIALSLVVQSHLSAPEISAAYPHITAILL